MRLSLIVLSRSFVQARRPSSTAYPTSGSLPYSRLTKMRVAYKNTENPCGWWIFFKIECKGTTKIAHTQVFAHFFARRIKNPRFCGAWKHADSVYAPKAMPIAHATPQKTYCPVLVFRVPQPLHNVFEWVHAISSRGEGAYTDIRRGRRLHKISSDDRSGCKKSAKALRMSRGTRTALRREPALKGSISDWKGRGVPKVLKKMTRASAHAIFL